MYVIRPSSYGQRNVLLVSAVRVSSCPQISQAKMRPGFARGDGPSRPACLRFTVVSSRTLRHTRRVSVGSASEYRGDTLGTTRRDATTTAYAHRPVVVTSWPWPRVQPSILP